MGYVKPDRAAAECGAGVSFSNLSQTVIPAGRSEDAGTQDCKSPTSENWVPGSLRARDDNYRGNVNSLKRPPQMQEDRHVSLITHACAEISRTEDGVGAEVEGGGEDVFFLARLEKIEIDIGVF